ncbi:uncharacterized protein MONOS_14676c1 [Monocercomonoides exilis]|uniref:uncharacterized protein n=1 Tax=Monocercomonoides exilis TaxID=2049356 RepID=UPI00355AB8E3|nr:hypothetical protein MONOS_14676c1 [Monocercomonoides exilis]|eukprot:MONOS_14676.1-p1 / transcript=MONOS_14676.1 / gene=MONOS_14676 / organism=Monocercomonoides_exilis_PA203 / gene_product=unspecified product / transcript_product=unspecified product / location=Mono_scaffold01048:893-1887(+) / protein_length=309 / sequence_SO=supercontig / SO=protein_coding / is_pseudo=false
MGNAQELTGTLRSSARFMIPPRSEEREVQVQMEEAKKADFRSKLSIDKRKGKQQGESKAKTKKKEKDEFCASHIETFDTKLAHAATERRRRDMGREEGGDENDDEQQQTFLLVRQHTLNCPAVHSIYHSLFAFASPPFSPLQHTQLSSPSVLSLDISHTSSTYFSNMYSSSLSSSITSFSLLIPCVILWKSRLGKTGVFASGSVSATRDAFEWQSKALSWAANVTSQRIVVGGEKEGKGEKKDEKRSVNEFESDKDEKGSLCLTDKCMDNEKNEEEEEEEEEDKENAIRIDNRKAQKERGAKEKLKTK